jgi:hypothetical protein
MVFPYLKGFYNKVVVLYIVSYILCGDFIHIYLVLLLYFVFRYLVLNKWYHSTFLGRHCGQIFFTFVVFFFREEKRGPRHCRHFWYISLQNLWKQVVDMISSHKKAQVEKTKSSETEYGKSRY